LSDSNEENEEDIILADLSDEELVEQMHDDLYDGLKEEIEEGTNILLSREYLKAIKLIQ
jgi:methanogenic corrinoid protein MtbC1